jgi:GTP-binding protein Era
MKFGYVSVVGRPNVGKSTLINNILGIKVSITSNKPQTTRNNIRGIYNDEESQIVFLDTPGIHKPKNKLGKFLNKETYSSFDETDLILFMVNAEEKLGKGDEFVLEKIKQEKEDRKVFLIINKIDRIKKEELINIINEYNKLYNFDEIIPISAIKDININDLLKTIKKYLPEGEKVYPEDEYTDKSLRFLISELVREKVLRKTKEEVPHSVTCVVEKYEETLALLDEEQIKYQEYLNSLVDLKLEKITTEVEVKIRVNDIELTKLEYMLKKLQREGAAAADEIKNIAD